MNWAVFHHLQDEMLNAFGACVYINQNMPLEGDPLRPIGDHVAMSSAWKAMGLAFRSCELAYDEIEATRAACRYWRRQAKLLSMDSRAMEGGQG